MRTATGPFLVTFRRSDLASESRSSDEQSKNGLLVEVMDQVRLAGVEGIAIAADKKAE